MNRRNQSDFILLIILIAMFALLSLGKWKDDDLTERVEVLELIHEQKERP